jgi:ABC-2 type transport system permease protein
MTALQTQIRREFWEHRSLWLAPPAIAIVLLLTASIFGHIIHIDFGSPHPPGNGDIQPPLFEVALLGWAVPFCLAALILATTYLLDCLYGERRDRSVLFWRSMPVSDARTVLVKLLVGLVIFPLGTFLLAALTSLAGSAILALRNHGVIINGASVPLWNALSWLRMQGIMLYGLIAAQLWYAPFAAYLMLISAWARRAPFAWAFVPPVLLVLFEHMVFGTYYVGRIVDGGFTELLSLAYRLDEHSVIDFDNTAAVIGDKVQVRFNAQLLDPLHLLSSPRLWWGLLAASVMIAVAIRLRRLRDDA